MADEDLEAWIGQWRTSVQRRGAAVACDVDELEDHLRDQISDLSQRGLSDDEAFLVAVKRMGNVDDYSREFAREHSDRLWKQLGLRTMPPEQGAGAPRTLVAAISFAMAAAVAVKAPSFFGLDIVEDESFYLRNLSVLVLPLLAGYLAWRRRVRVSVLGLVGGVFAVGAAAANAYPFASGGATELLLAIHLPIVLWFVVGLVYVGGDWRSAARRMDFVRFTGEWVVYYALIALGGGVLVAISAAVFFAIGIDLGTFVEAWLVPCGAAGAVVIAAWLVEAKQSVVENMAPVLTKVFTPLFTLMLLAFLAAVAWTRAGVDVERELLIAFDLVLVLVLGLLLYAISARDPLERPGGFDRLQLLLVVSALAVDLIVLFAMVSRISEWGFSPNKVASLGLNLILLVNLAWSARLLAGAIRTRGTIAALERWQTTYLPVLAAWVTLVALALPPAFGYV